MSILVVVVVVVVVVVGAQGILVPRKVAQQADLPWFSLGFWDDLQYIPSARHLWVAVCFRLGGNMNLGRIFFGIYL